MRIRAITDSTLHTRAITDFSTAALTATAVQQRAYSRATVEVAGGVPRRGGVRDLDRGGVGGRARETHERGGPRATRPPPRRESWGARTLYTYAHDNNRNTRPLFASPPPCLSPRLVRLRAQEDPCPPPHCVGSPSGFDTVVHCAATARPLPVPAASMSAALRVRQPDILDRLAGPRGDAVEVGAGPQAAELVEQIGRRCAHCAA